MATAPREFRRIPQTEPFDCAGSPEDARAVAGSPENARAVASGRWQYPAARTRSPHASLPASIRIHSLQCHEYRKDRNGRRKAYLLSFLEFVGSKLRIESERAVISSRVGSRRRADFHDCSRSRCA